ncbi:TRL-like family protein [Granulosicoccaceae sp. 1_MG-2023]|nr:TRL-like family protein [Granulosicoccaceae sp. 1_MG-2023]
MKLSKTLAPVCLLALLSGCATSVPIGSIYTDITLPMESTSAQGGSKVGTAECTSILAILATGDCSIEAAKANGGISQVTHVDWKVNNILGVIGKYTTTVHGN